ncbi:17-beta-hydroxysteroid dehydrogenase type 6-like [Spea bombifrons]|uniref:17-beta-hydroxysteroid dehydrogenase type 6-like n=1 Tax=Spea bombifrons TaxID=233779 RepID=UPI002349ACAF|nr:17-beta-hydroxysteroid dehydrogenase type 6-like [Spea bombifrons]
MWLPLLVVLLALLFLYRWYRQSQMLENLSDKYVLITGCDSGFGNLLAKQLDRRGMQVLAACLTEKGADDLNLATSSRLQTVILDVTDSQSVSNAVKWVIHKVSNKGLWGLVNNAGIVSPAAPNEWLTIEDFSRVLNVNLLGTISVTLSLLSLIRKAQGRIVNMSSVMGRLAFLGGGYCISKHGIEAFSDSLRRELQPFGVKVAIIEPSSYRTPATDQQATIKSICTIWSKVPLSIQDSYGQQYFQDYCELIQHKLSKCIPHLTQVTDYMEHALIAVHPWTRYSAGWNTKLFYLPVSYLPTVISDYLLTRSFPKPAITKADNKRTCI